MYIWFKIFGMGRLFYFKIKYFYLSLYCKFLFREIAKLTNRPHCSDQRETQIGLTVIMAPLTTSSDLIPLFYLFFHDMPAL